MTEYIYASVAGLFLAATILLLQPGAPAEPPQQIVIAQGTPPAATGDIAPIGYLASAPSLSAAQIDSILSSYGSPAAGSGQDFYDLGVQWGIDPAYALAFFVEESSAGTDPRWDGLKSDGTTTHDIGNISCGGRFACYGRWRDYPDWRTGIEDWYRLIHDEYMIGRGHQTVDEVIPVYAPSFENDVGGYTNTVSALVAKWRAENPPEDAPAPALRAVQAQAVGEPYLLQGDVGTNVQAALNANGGALTLFTIPPGGIWSFGHTIAPISGMGYLPVVCGPAGCNPGGGWCDLSALYVKVADQLGIESHFPAHAGVSDPRFPGIMLDNNGDGGDLTITNTTPQAVTFQTRVDGDRLIVEGRF